MRLPYRRRAIPVRARQQACTRGRPSDAEIIAPTQEALMAFPFTAIAVALQSVVAAADVVPNINYASSCRAAAAASASLGITADNQSVSACMAEEKDARDKLVQQWTQFSPTDRMHCEQEAALGQMP